MGRPGEERKLAFSDITTPPVQGKTMRACCGANWELGSTCIARDSDSELRLHWRSDVCDYSKNKTVMSVQHYEN